MRFFEQQAAARVQSIRLVLLFALAVAATVLAVHGTLSLLWWGVSLFLPVSRPAYFTEVNLGLPLLLVLGGWWIEWSNLQGPEGAQRLAARMGARELRPSASQAEQRLGNIVDEVTIAAHMPRPLVMVLPRMQAINAMAAGMDQDSALIMVSQGALDWLTRDELQGLVAHECSHIHEGDTRLHMQLAGMVAGLELVWGMGDALRERTAPSISAVLGIVIMTVGIFGWWAGRALQAAVSRQRELLADARAVQWTRSRDGLGGVLRKALAQRAQPATTWRDPAWCAAFSHLLLVGPSREQGGWLDAHPPLTERIRRVYGRPMPPLHPGTGLSAPAVVSF